METRVKFISGDIVLEGLLGGPAGGPGVVITHPHPLYGGDMYNSVVATMARAYEQKGYQTLRFNFRGTGQSQGRFDDGQGEQKDVGAAILYLKSRGAARVDLAGYSFGAWVNALAGQNKVEYERMILVSPPVGFISFDDVDRIPNLSLVIAGSRDDIGPVARISPLVPAWNPDARLEIIQGADHFFSGYLNQLENIITLAL